MNILISGYPEPSVKWYKNGSEIFKPEYPCSFDKGVAKFTIPKAIEKDSGHYTCTARNIAGTASSNAELVVKRKSNFEMFNLYVK